VETLKWLYRKVAVILAVHWARALEYRIVIFIWILASTVPLVMMAAWVHLSTSGPIGGYSAGDFIAYYMANLLVMQVVSTWHGWELTKAIRQGELNPLLLKPFHPLWHFGLRAIPTKPLRLPIYLPPIIAVTLLVPGVHYDLRPVALLAFALSLIIAYMLTFFMQTAIALSAFWISEATPFVTIWYQFRILFSGYIIPLSLFPDQILRVIRWLPFRFTVSLPLEIIVGKLPQEEWALTFAVAIAWTGFFFGLMHLIWNRGLRVYAAFGA